MISTNVNAVHRWKINAGYRADLQRCFHEHINYNYTSTKIYHHQESKTMKVMYHQWSLFSRKHSSLDLVN